MRALVVAAPVRALAGPVRECRIVWNAEVELPQGVYWFQGVDDGPIILQVASGSLPGDPMVVSVGNLDDDHPLADTWRWAEELRGNAALVLQGQAMLEEDADGRAALGCGPAAIDGTKP